MYIIEIIFTASLEEIAPHLEAHRAHFKSYFDQGYLYAYGPKDPRTGGFIIVLQDDENFAKKLVENDPYYKNKLADYKVQKFNPVNVLS